MTYAFRITLLWILGCMLAFVTAMNFLPATLVDGQYIPVSNDSFYHARRILDTVANPDAFYEFDAKINYPEGSWITWPWAYDYFVAQIVRAHLWLFGPRDPMSVLAYVPVVAITIPVALIIAITGLLGMSLLTRALIVVVFGLSSLTQTMHGAGVIDHHFVEHIFVLLGVFLGMLWMRHPARTWPAFTFGAVLGVAVAFHNGLFVLQLPPLAALVLVWFRNDQGFRSSAGLFSAGLLTGTVVAVLPSAMLWEGVFEFYLLSWFHVYVACCTSLIACLLATWPRSRRNLALLASICLLLLIPLGARAMVGSSFITGQLDVIKDIDEVKNPLLLATTADGAARLSNLYGEFIWLAPLFLLISLVQVFRVKRPDYRYFWITAAFGLLLLLQQLRFHYFGSLALFIVPFWCLNELRDRWPRMSKTFAVASCALLALAMASPIRNHLFTRIAPGMDPDYANIRDIYPVLATACKRDPGAVLSSTDDGHYVRYHTDCPVIVNNFRITEQHARSIARAEYLHSLSPEAFLREAPEVKYLIASLVGFYEGQPDGSLKPTPPETVQLLNSRLNSELLLSPPGSNPQRFRRLLEVRFNKEVPYPIARLYEIHPAHESLEAAAGSVAEAVSK